MTIPPSFLGNGYIKPTKILDCGVRMSSRKKKRNPRSAYVRFRECASFRLDLVREVAELRERVVKTETRLGILIIVADLIIALVIWFIKGG